MPRIGKSQNAVVQFESRIQANLFGRFLCRSRKLIHGVKPCQLSIEAEMQDNPSAHEPQQQILTPPLHTLDSLSSDTSGEAFR